MPEWSKRLPSKLEETDFSREFSRACDSETLDLRTSNPTSVNLQAQETTSAAYRRSVDAPEVGTYEPSAAGDLEARRSISTYYDQRGASVDPDDIVLCASTSEAYTWLAKLLTEPGDAYAVPTPSYPLFDHLLGLESLRSRTYRLSFDGRWHTDVGSVTKLFENCDPRAFVDVSPNNPTGHCLRGSPLERVADILADGDTPLIVDEVFLDYTRDDTTPSSLLAHLQQRSVVNRPPTVMLSGLSKVAALPGAKVGWMVLDGPRDWRTEARRRLRYIADTFLSVTTVGQIAVPEVLETTAELHSELNARLQTNARATAELIDQIDVATRHSGRHGWYELIRLPNTVGSDKLAFRLADEQNVALQPGFLYDLPETTLVVSLLQPAQRHREGLARLQNGLVDVYE